VTQAIRLLKLFMQQYPSEKLAEHWAKVYPMVIPGYNGMNPAEQRDAREPWDGSGQNPTCAP
jgi:hypothetical protein